MKLNTRRELNETVLVATQYGGGTQTKEMDDEYNSFMAAIGEKKDTPGGGGGGGGPPLGGGGPGGPRAQSVSISRC